jgi:hypothetical protein
MNQVIGNDQKCPADVTHKVIRGKEFALHQTEQIPRQGFKKGGSLDESKIKKGPIPKDEGEIMYKAKNGHRHPPNNIFQEHSE